MEHPLAQGAPFDWVIVAAASAENSLITRDQHMIESGLGPTLW